MTGPLPALPNAARFLPAFLARDLDSPTPTSQIVAQPKHAEDRETGPTAHRHSDGGPCARAECSGDADHNHQLTSSVSVLVEPYTILSRCG